jgi:alpha-D-xyloside xylohydrolase
MKRILLAIAVLGLFCSLQAQNVVNWNTGKMDVKVEYFTPSIVRIVKTPTGSESRQPSLVVLAKPENVSITEKGKNVTS